MSKLHLQAEERAKLVRKKENAGRPVQVAHLETHTRSQTPHFMSYPMDMTWILQHQVYFLAKCHIHVISMSYLFFKKDMFGYTWYILN